MVKAKVKTEKEFKCAECNKTFAGASGLWYHNKYSHGVKTKTRKKSKKTVQMKNKPKETLKKNKDSIKPNAIQERYFSPINISEIDSADDIFGEILQIISDPEWMNSEWEDYDGTKLERTYSFEVLDVPKKSSKLDTKKRKRNANISGENSGEKPKKYSKEERRKLIDKWLNRRKNRNWSKRTIYTPRQNFSKNRPRYKGKFVKMNKINK